MTMVIIILKVITNFLPFSPSPSQSEFPRPLGRGYEPPICPSPDRARGKFAPRGSPDRAKPRKADTARDK